MARKRGGLRLTILLAVLLSVIVLVAGPAWAASISLSASSVEPGDTMGVTGSGFEPGGVRLCWEGRGCETWSATADENGAFSTAIQIPEVESSGTYTLYACQGQGNETVCASEGVTVTVPPPPTTTTVPPITTTTLLPATTTTLPATTTTTFPLTTTTTIAATTTLPASTNPPPVTTTTSRATTTTTEAATTTSLAGGPQTTTPLTTSSTTTKRTESIGPTAGGSTTTLSSAGSEKLENRRNGKTAEQSEAEVLGAQVTADDQPSLATGTQSEPVGSGGLPSWLWILLIPVEVGLVALVVREIRRSLTQ